MIVVKWREDGTYLSGIAPRLREAKWRKLREQALRFPCQCAARRYIRSRFGTDAILDDWRGQVAFVRLVPKKRTR